MRHLRRADPVLARLVDQVGPCLYEVRRGGGPFAYLIAAIVHQQLAGAAAATIHRRLCALAGRKHPKAMQKAFRKRALPRPDWMRKTAEPWRPYRSVACWYLWRSLDG